MAYVINKTPEQERRQEKILRDFGYNPKQASKEQRELAEHIAEKCHEAMKGGCHA